jgi:tetratricopeptide (TPR) repeat protein
LPICLPQRNARRRKHTLPFLFAIITLITVSVLTYCSADRSKEIVFKAERLFRTAERLYETIAHKPELSDRDSRNRLKDAYFAVTDFCWKNIDSLPPETYPNERRDLESVAFLATNRLSQIYFSDKKFDSVIFVVKQLQNFANLEGFPLLSVNLNLARALQSGGDWVGAMKIYRILMDTFYPPVDNNNEVISRVLNLPLDIVGMYKLLGDEESANREFQAAGEYYCRLIDEWPNSSLETAARGNLARLYYGAEDWERAIDNLKLIKDSTGQVELEAATMIAAITASGKKDYKTAVSLYDGLLARTSDTTVQPLLLVRKGVVYFRDGQYNKCREIMSEVNDRFPDFFERNPLPQKYIALSFGSLGDWRRAENEFRWLIDNYPATEAAFEAHLTIADHYEKENNTELTQAWYRRAEEFYYRMANQHSGSGIEASAISYLAEIARRRGKWDTAARYLESLYAKYPGTEIGRKALVNASMVYRDRLDDPVRADSLIARFKAELYPLDEGKNINTMTDDNI